jgi:dihydrofolate reductase
LNFQNNMHRPKISIIAAIGEKRELGKNNKLLFTIPDDLRRFREKTKGHAVIMGRKTFESIVSYSGKPLPGRLNIVLSHYPNKSEIGEKEFPLYFRNNWKQAIEEAEKWEQQHAANDREIFVIGGGQIYKDALERDFVDRLYLTIVEGTADADTFFPGYEHLGFKKVSEEERESDGHRYTFVTLEK